MTAFPFLQAWDDAAARCRGALPAVASKAARDNAFDTAACMAAGTRENATLAALRAAGGGGELTQGEAAMVLGTASHALDYDDVCMLAVSHPSAPVLAALLALLPRLRERDTTLGDVFGAYALGTETTLRLGQWLGFRHYALGFHATSTLGSVGVAAAVAHALGLDPAQSHHALAIAASSSCGLRANFGTDTKPLHVGFAAAGGLRAALLAQAGARASNDVWGTAGFYQAFDGGAAFAALPWRPGMAFALVQPGFELKRFPSCYLTHRLIAGILKLRERHPQAAGAMVDIDVELARDGAAALKHPRPTTGLEGKFSGPYSAAAAWVDGRADLGCFSDEAVKRAPHLAQMQRVTIRERTTTGETLELAPVHVAIRGAGIDDRITVDWAPGSLADPFTREQLQAKWRDCAAHAGLGGADAMALGLLDAPLDSSADAVLGPLRQTLLAHTQGAAR